MKRLLIALGCLTVPVSLFPFPRLSAQKRAITIGDYLALKSVGNPQLSPDGKWVAYTVTEQSLKDNRGMTRIWLADVASGAVRQLTAGPGSDRQPRWSPDGRTLAFVSTRETGAQLWVLPIAGGEARRVTSLADGVFDPLWLPDGTGLIVTSDIKWPAQQEIDRRNDDFPTDARLWTGLLWRHWDDWRAGKRQHLFTVTLADGSTRDVTPVDHDVPTIATGGDGDVSVSPDGKEIAVAMHGDSTVADNTNVDVYLTGPDGSGMRALTTGRGADNTPRYSPDGKWLAYLSMERAGFEADRQRLMLVGRSDGRTGGPSVEATKGWTLSVGSYIWCPDSKCVYAVVEERGRDNIYRIDLPSFRRSLALGGGGVKTDGQAMPGGRGLLYLHQSNTQPNETWLPARPPTHPPDTALAGLDPLPYVDSTRMGAAGASYGGYMIYWMAGHTRRFKALVAHDGLFNPVNMAGTTEELWFVDWEFGGTPYANRALYEKWSPLNFVQNWKTPILIVHSQLDYRVDLSEGYQAFTAAKLQGVPAKFLYFPDEGHWVLRPRNRRLWWGTVLDWIDQSLKPAPTGAR